MSKIWWIEREGPGRLGIVSCPSGKSLEQDLQAAKDAGAHEIISLLTADEVESGSLHAEAETARRLGMKFKRFGIQDHGVPTVDRGLDGFLKAISKELEHGRSVLVHCNGGKGRSGLITGAVMAMEGMDVDDALKALRAARHAKVPETDEQEQWLHDFAQQYRPLAQTEAERDTTGIARLQTAVVIGLVCILGVAAYLGHAKSKKKDWRFVL
ncbi:MAG: dual specificity protein phosphatase family protein [Fimbriimonas sp.]